ncbi:amylo-alpha-1,6-glucosidase, partial [Chroococcidiopsis cubana CCALA 043]
MTLDTIATQDRVEISGRVFVPAEQLPIPEWPCVLSERPQPTLTIKDDDLFLVTDTLGNIAGGCYSDDSAASMGLFCCDSRFLSRLELQIEGRSPVLLSSTADKGFSLSVLCTNPTVDNRLKADTLGIRRELVLNGALFEEIEISNYSTSAVSVSISLSFDADFVDLFEIRGFNREKRGKLLRLAAVDGRQKEKGDKEDKGDKGAITNYQLPITDYQPPETLTLAYQGLDNSIMESRLQFQHTQPDLFKGYTAIWQLDLASHETKKLGYRLSMAINDRSASTVHAPNTLVQARAAEDSEELHWCQQSTQIRSDKADFNHVVERAEQDMYLLRQSFGKYKTVSAGVPWFSTLFGRDSLIAAAQTLMLNPSIARETLILLAAYQGKIEDEWREEEPGKILHEIRMGEMARCQEIPHTPYYGTIDATPLWLMLYAEYFAWTHDLETLDR